MSDDTMEYASMARSRKISIPTSVAALRAKLAHWAAEIEADRRKAAALEHRAPIAPRPAGSADSATSPWGLVFGAGTGEIVGIVSDS